MSRFPAAIKTLHARVSNTNTDPAETDGQDIDSLGFHTLYDPTPNSTIADIIFIHGLGGHSRKTWSSSSAPGSFWPQDWLPFEPGFENVRIHSFGYRADWGKRWQQQSILNIHDFAESLIGGLRNNPSIRRDDTRIILVGHSMGGCVAKEAFIIARQHPSYKDLAGRIYGIFFLGTPHHGSDLAGILENMLIAVWGKKPFVTDLKAGSSALAMIRDRFRHVAIDLALWTFYETLPTALGPLNRIVVEKDSAILGFDKERVEAMNADHRHICKFTSREDSNYRMLRNALHTAIDEIQEKTLDTAFLSLNTIDRDVETDAQLESFFKLRDVLEEDLTLQSELKMPESCEWLINKPQFLSWKAGDAANIFWLIGRPATGKSILSTHVIDHLNSMPVYCSYFFFKHSTANRSTLGDCFRSLAFQMAIQDGLVKEQLIELENEGLAWDKADDTTIWTKLFVDRIFKLSFTKQHYWVIDGLDECANFNSLFTKKLLTKLPHRNKLRIFVTSRNLDVIERGLASLGPQASTYALSNSDTLNDIRLFLTTKLEELGRFETEDELRVMCDKMLEKSSGSFLWARLVLQELESAWTEEAMEDILNEVPGELYDLYSKMVQSIEMDRSKIILAKTILKWVVLARRPLSLEELRSAVKLDLNQTIQNMRRAISDICGQLVYVDAADKAHIIHATAREFLLDQDVCSELTVYKELGHTRIASVLARFLSGDCFKAQQARSQRPAKFRSSTKTGTQASLDASLLDYASKFFAEHVYRCSSEDDDLMDNLSTFLNTNVLSWIEFIAKSGDLSTITRAAMNIREYLARRAKYVPPTDLSISIVAGWVTDLIRVAAKFHAQLLTHPHAIHRLIPPLCPSESMIFRRFSKDLRTATMTIKGLPAGTWDDCLSRIDFQRGQTTAVSHSYTSFAVGLSTGQIFLYNAGSVQLQLTMTHPERVKILQFSEDDNFLASCGAKHMVIWKSKSGSQIYAFPLSSPPLTLAFLGVDELFCMCQSGTLTRWSLETQQDGSSFDQTDNIYSNMQSIISQHAATCAAFLVTTDAVLLAVGYRKHPVFIWDVLEQQGLGHCVVDANNGIDCMVFNPNPDIIALVISLNDGRLCVFDYFTMKQMFTVHKTFAQSVACSPDGHSLVTGGSHGTIEVFDFDHDYDGNIILVPIYRIDGMYDPIRNVAFSFNGLRFLDVHRQQCRVWEPAALVRTNNELESTSDAATLPITAVGAINGSEDPEITSVLEITSDGRYAIGGNQRGEVSLFSIADGAETGTLYRHAKGVSVTKVALGESRNLVVSADESGRVLISEPSILLREVTKLVPGQKMPETHTILDRRFGGVVVRLLLNSTADRLLVTGHNVSQLWALPSGELLAAKQEANVDGNLMESHCSDDIIQPTTSTCAAFQHPSNDAWFVTMSGNTARVFSWANYEELTSKDGILLQRPKSPGKVASPRETRFSPKSERFSPHSLNADCAFSTASYHVGCGVVIETLQAIGAASPQVNIWPAAEFDPYSPRTSFSTVVSPSFSAMRLHIRSVIGFISPSTLIFLDTRLWVCSIDIQPLLDKRDGRLSGSQSSLPGTSVRRHFFALSEWCDAEGEMKCSLVAVPGMALQSVDHAVVFVSGHKLVTIKGGFQFSENMTV